MKVLIEPYTFFDLTTSKNTNKIQNSIILNLIFSLRSFLFLSLSICYSCHLSTPPSVTRSELSVPACDYNQTSILLQPQHSHHSQPCRMSGTASWKPDNFLDDPDSLLRQARKDKQKASQESPPAPTAPTYLRRPEATASGSPSPSDRILYASSHRPSPAEVTTSHFSPPEISPSTSEKTIIDLHFQKLFGQSSLDQTPHPPGHFATDTPSQDHPDVTFGASTLTCGTANTMSHDQDTIESLRQQVESLRVQNETLAQGRQETLTLQRMVRDLMSERSVGYGSPGHGSLGGPSPGVGRAGQVFSGYLNRTPVSPTPAPRIPPVQQENPTSPLPPSAPVAAVEPLPPVAEGRNEEGAQVGATSERTPQSDHGPEDRAPRAEQHPMPPSSPHHQPTPYMPWYPPYYPPFHDIPARATPTAVTADRIKLSDLPKFNGKFGNPADLFHWQDMIEETFDVKNLTDDRERLKLLGSLLNNEAMSAWYQANKETLRQQSWKSAMDLMATGTLPHSWLADAFEALRRLEMKTPETFDNYVARAQGLHRLVKRSRGVTDRNLAEYITWGAPRLFQTIIDREKHLQAEPFSFPVFKDAADGIWRFLTDSKIWPDGSVRVKQSQPTTSQQPTPALHPRPVTQPRIRSDDERADNAWRYHEYLRKFGLCVICKEKCNNPNCTKHNTRFLSIPPDFNPGPRPTRPTASNNQAKPPGAPTQRPAGRPPVAQTVPRVAAIETFPDVMAEDIAAYEEADQYRMGLVEEEADEAGRSWDEPVVERDGA